MSSPAPLQLRAAAGAPLTPEQRRFNQLVAKIDTLRATLARWQAQRPAAMQALAQRARPVQAQIHAGQRALAGAFEHQIGQPGWTPAQRRLWTAELCDLLAALIDDPSTGDVEAGAARPITLRGIATGSR